MSQVTTTLASTELALNTTLMLLRSGETPPYCVLKYTKADQFNRTVYLASFVDRDLVLVEDARQSGAAASAYSQITLAIEGQKVVAPITQFTSNLGLMMARLPPGNEVTQYLGWKQPFVGITPNGATTVPDADIIALGEPPDFAGISVGWQSCIATRNRLAGVARDPFIEDLVRSLAAMQSATITGPAVGATASQKPAAAAAAPRSGPSTPENNPEGARAAQEMDDARIRCERDAIRANQMQPGRGGQDVNQFLARRSAAIADCSRQFPQTNGFIGPQNLSRQAAPGQLSPQEQANLEELNARIDAQRRLIEQYGIRR